MRSTRLLPPLLLSFLTAGCATVVHGTRQDVRVETEPPGATASVEGQTITTPGVLRLRRKEKALEVLIEKEGYVSRRVPLARKTSGAVWGNFGFIPVGAASGAAIGDSTTNDWDFFERMANGGLVGGLVLPGVAFAVDYANGAAYKLDPPTILVRLEPAGEAETEKK